MTDTNDDLRPALPELVVSGDEATTLTEMLDFYRAVLERKGSGLSPEQLNIALAPSDLTIGGLIFHMALVEDGWFHQKFHGNEPPEPWASVDWESDYDWEFNNAHTLTPDQLFAQYHESIARSRHAYSTAESLDDLAALTKANGEKWNLRWIMVHMIEEYARHCGHADFIRQSIDGKVDD